MGGEETRYIVRGSEKQQKRQKIQARQWRWRQRVIRNWNRPKGFAEGERESKERKERERAEKERKGDEVATEAEPDEGAKATEMNNQG